ncbi:MAG: hypothetical protein AAGN66_21780 [Acidobacteriota bacterium]
MGLRASKGFRVRIVLCLLAIALGGTSTVSADGPGETLTVPIAEVAAEVLTGAVGVLTVTLPATDPYALEHDRRLRGLEDAIRSGALDAAPTVRPDGDGFAPSTPLVLGGTTPLGGWTSTFERVRRFPVLGHDRARLRIVVDPGSGRTVWVDTAEWMGALTPFGASAGLEWARFDVNGPLSVAVDPFWLGPGPRALYERPSPDTEVVYIQPTAKIPGEDSDLTFADHRGAFWLREIRRGFGHLWVDVPGEGRRAPQRPLGWIQLRDASGRLTVWPTRPARPR